MSFNETTPAIIFVRPQMGENIGFSARSMSNFGLTDLRIISPEDSLQQDFIKKALVTAKKASSVISSLKMFENLSDCLEDINYAYAVTGRSRDLLKALNPPKVAFKKMEKSANIKTAFIFGPENNGLSNQDLSLANELLIIPTVEEYSSMNLAQAVSVICYEWYNLVYLKDKEFPDFEKERKTATKGELTEFFEDLESKLKKNDFFIKTPEKEEKMKLNIRNIFSRHEITSQELRTLRGIIKNITKNS